MDKLCAECNEGVTRYYSLANQVGSGNNNMFASRDSMRVALLPFDTQTNAARVIGLEKVTIDLKGPIGTYR